MQYDTVEGREALDFSDWSTARREAIDELAESIDEGEMPPSFYTWPHPEARLTATERATLRDGLATLGRPRVAAGAVTP